MIKGITTLELMQTGKLWNIYGTASQHAQIEVSMAPGDESGWTHGRTVKIYSASAECYQQVMRQTREWAWSLRDVPRMPTAGSKRQTKLTMFARLTTS